jgi:hypothetical protein
MPRPGERVVRARRAVGEFGFSPRAGQLVGGLGGRPVRLAESTHRVIDEEVERMIAEAYSDAIALVTEHGSHPAGQRRPFARAPSAGAARRARGLHRPGRSRPARAGSVGPGRTSGDVRGRAARGLATGTVRSPRIDGCQRARSAGR